MISKLKNSPLFAGMSEEDIASCLKCSGSQVSTYEKDELIFSQGALSNKLRVLVEGSVVVCSDSSAGKRSIIATFSEAGALFGEVFLFLKKGESDHYAQAAGPAAVLEIPKNFLYQTCGEGCGYHTRLISNMLTILAQKAYHLNRKLQILSCATLRQKIAMVLLDSGPEDGMVELSMNREELADYLNTARPSLSRELSRMRQDGLLKMEGRRIYISNLDGLKNII